MNEAPIQTAWRFHQAGRLAEAARLYADILHTSPQNYDALYQLGMIHLQSDNFAEADRLFSAAARVNSQSAELFYNHGCALQGLGRNEEALNAFAHALALKPGFAEARNNRGVVLLAINRPKDALACFDRVLAENPRLSMVHTNRATALLALQEPLAAITACDAALRENPRLPGALYSKGAALAALSQADEALSFFTKAIAVDPNHADAYIHRGVVLTSLSRHQDALDGYNKALAIKPGNIEALYNRSTSLIALRRFEDAISECEQVLKLDAHFKYARGNRLFAKMHCCDWNGIHGEKAAVIADLRAGLRALRPLQAVAITDSLPDLRQCARIWTANEAPPAPKPLWQGEYYRHDRIRIAYVSADFRMHPVSVLSVEMFEHHDKSQCETIAISLGQSDGSLLRHRLENAFDQFIDARNKSDEEIATLLHAMQIDIAVDLTGFTENAKTAIFAQRPAGIQVNYLGYPGTLGAPYYDYLIADPWVVPNEHQAQYDENIVCLPHSYLPNDSTRVISEKVPTRAESGLPEYGFVFCSFNVPYKITPDIYAIWLRLLEQADGSVLWLNQANSKAITNLRREADKHGIAGERIIFAPFVSAPEDHLARIQLADLFLDTFPYNAHATACDALWAGVPIVTMTGTSLASRVGASLLSAAGLPELITTSPEHYEALAARMARNPAELSSLRERLTKTRSQCPLFDSARFTRNIEAAYRKMWNDHQSGLPPKGFAVSELSLP